VKFSEEHRRKMSANSRAYWRGEPTKAERRAGIVRDPEVLRVERRRKVAEGMRATNRRMGFATKSPPYAVVRDDKLAMLEAMWNRVVGEELARWEAAFEPFDGYRT
jgi:hypothetical protein